VSSERRDVVIVGAGVAGLTLAYELARRGAAVTVLDRSEGPAGASAVPAALLNPHRGRTARAHPGDLAGLEAFWRLMDDLEEQGFVPGAHRTGALRVASTARQAVLWRALAGAGEAGPRWLAPDEVPAGVAAPHGALFVTGGGWVEPRRLLAALADASGRLGAEVRRGVAITTVERDASGATAVTTAGTWRARHVVVCAGADPKPLACRLPRLSVEGGVAAVLRPPAGETARLAALPPLAGAVNAVFTGDRAVVTGGSVPPEGLCGLDVAAAAAQLRDAAAWSVPGLADAEVEGAWTGLRARRQSGRPVVRRLSPHVTFYGAMAGRGFLCAADVSARLAGRLGA